MNSLHANGATTCAMAAPSDEKPVGEKEPVPDAGLKSLDHYKRALPKWRYNLRQSTLPLVRWETPYLAWMQDKLRTPALDSYFAITANLGTHTFFMIGLPIFFWCGFAPFGKALVRMLASGVFFSGFVKDFFSLPRPLSPPLHRITMSDSVALEYGFPSTHSANAVSVAVYGILSLYSPENTLPPTYKFALEILAYWYAVSIVFGRLYCGMHGFLDVIVGSLMGAAISLVEFYYGAATDAYFLERTFSSIVMVALVIIVLIRIHPEPADDCPCFDDSVAFAGVVVGVEMGTWHLGRSSFGAIPFDAAALGWAVVILRIAVGVPAVVAWREVAKPTLLRSLPHLFRFLEVWGVNLPRRFFMPASEYKNIPLRIKVDNVMPNVSDLPRFVNSIRKGGRGRSVSVGPQSAADAYETLAYRERRRRESIGSNGSHSLRSKNSIAEMRESSPTTAIDEQGGQSSGVSGGVGGRLSYYERMMGEGTVIVGSASPGEEKDRPEDPEMYIGRQDELGEREVFSKLVRPRVRYDVEVVTKLIVYTGIGLVAVDFVPIMFEFIGLGAAHLAYS
ncbi:PAP2 superfamily-domain-containing protein [Pseudomassariella vexata]|uniref:PAP2 superfamily-domain-containing protein n=1 Tax=Pseudomassariella vexata TaxID=1141098 RepID=A0A1Y2DCZ5_9PEZI|nr:PAP2 superfamily-domain-containing protein [Pseudomassariella vexata]ORY56984.1 PAP2 superfamily-domain-containing protein [Pseudomassariella vexata]